MDEIDRKLLNIIQAAFPLAEEPYLQIGRQLGIEPQEALDRVRKLKETGIIRRVGAVFNPNKLGYVSTLCAARVPAERIRDFVAHVNGYRGVTHNYRRNHAYNIWFTFIAADQEELSRSLTEIKRTTGIDDILDLRAVRTFKINAVFDL